jgi:hypothetical protein
MAVKRETFGGLIFVSVHSRRRQRNAEGNRALSGMDQATLNHLRQWDRKQLELLLAVVNGAMRAMRRDECGDPTIIGSRGTIRACDAVFYVYIASGSVRAWTAAKKRLAAFTTVHQDGDDEGILVLSRMPDEDEAATLRKYIGLRQTRDIPPEQIQQAQDAVRKGT